MKNFKVVFIVNNTSFCMEFRGEFEQVDDLASRIAKQLGVSILDIIEIEP